MEAGVGLAGNRGNGLGNAAMRGYNSKWPLHPGGEPGIQSGVVSGGATALLYHRVTSLSPKSGRIVSINAQLTLTCVLSFTNRPFRLPVVASARANGLPTSFRLLAKGSKVTYHGYVPTCIFWRSPDWQASWLWQATATC